MRAFAWSLIVLVCLSLTAFEKKSSVIFRVHEQTDADATGKFAMPVVAESKPGQTVYISKIPMMSEKNIKSIYVYDSPGGGKGVAFKLDSHGSMSLSAMSAQRYGRLFFVFMNGRNIAELLVDRHVGDGILNVPRGFNAAEIALLAEHYPILGAETPEKGKSTEKKKE